MRRAALLFVFLTLLVWGLFAFDQGLYHDDAAHLSWAAQHAASPLRGLFQPAVTPTRLLLAAPYVLAWASRAPAAVLQLLLGATWLLSGFAVSALASRLFPSRAGIALTAGALALASTGDFLTNSSVGLGYGGTALAVAAALAAALRFQDVGRPAFLVLAALLLNVGLAFSDGATPLVALAPLLFLAARERADRRWALTAGGWLVALVPYAVAFARFLGDPGSYAAAALVARDPAARARLAGALVAHEVMPWRWAVRTPDWIDRLPPLVPSWLPVLAALAGAAAFAALAFAHGAASGDALSGGERRRDLRIALALALMVVATHAAFSGVQLAEIRYRTHLVTRIFVPILLALATEALAPRLARPRLALALPVSLSASGSRAGSSGRTPASRRGAGTASSSPRSSGPRPPSTRRRRSSSPSRPIREASRRRASPISPRRGSSCSVTAPRPRGPSSTCRAGAPTAGPAPPASRARTAPARACTRGTASSSCGSTRRRPRTGSSRISRSPPERIGRRRSSGLGRSRPGRASSSRARAFSPASCRGRVPRTLCSPRHDPLRVLRGRPRPRHGRSGLRRKHSRDRAHRPRRLGPRRRRDDPGLRRQPLQPRARQGPRLRRDHRHPRRRGHGARRAGRRRGFPPRGPDGPRPLPHGPVPGHRHQHPGHDRPRGGAQAPQLLAAGSDAALGEVLNVGGGEPTTFREVAETFASLTGAHWELAPFSAECKAQESGDFYSDVSKIRRLLGWAPRTFLAEGLEQTLAYYRVNRAQYW